MLKPILIVQGGQWGSEAKGAIAAYLCNARKVDVAVRTGATNAGHTCYAKSPKTGEMTEFKMQQLPVGFVNPDTVLVIGAGALIDPEILKREVTMLEGHGYSIRDRLKIDRRAGLHVPAHQARSKASGRHHGIGATGKGCSEALIDRIRCRGELGYHLFGDSAYAHNYETCDTETFLNWGWDEGAQILLEGTQGQMLDLYLGPYPYTTHKQTGPAQWMLECGLSPALPVEICMVIRTFPIRVAGNSGPMPQETSWPLLARQINDLRYRAKMGELVDEAAIRDFEQKVEHATSIFKVPDGSDGLDMHNWTDTERSECRVAASELHKEALGVMTDGAVAELRKLFEMTTVTKKLRRIAALDHDMLQAAARQMRPTWIAVTFMNYLFPQFWYEKPKLEEGYSQTTADQREFVHWVESVCHAPVNLLTYGPHDSHVVDLVGRK